ncbi:DUF6660 family protein [Emticicia fontis]
MKILQFILSMYILTLSFLPCGDVEDCNEVGNVPVIFSQSSHSEHQDDAEFCSPFCICTCCGTNISYNFHIPFLASEDQPYVFTQNLRVAYKNDSSLSNFFGNIWQPPKLS